MFYAGFARLDITPPLGIPLTGYYRSRYADGVLDPLEINALAVSDGEKKAVLLRLDCPFSPRPALLPHPELSPRPTRLRRLRDPGVGLIS